MKLKPVKRKVQVPPPEPPKQERKKTKNTLPSDEYKPIYEPVRFKVREVPSRKDPDSKVKQYVEVSVKRNDSDNGLPYMWMTLYQESDFYTGYLKGKTVYLPVKEVPTLLEHLEDLLDQCERDGLLGEELD